jgi:acyl carrier protein
MKKNVFEIIRDILQEKLGIADTEIKPYAHFLKDLGIDSLEYTEMVMEFEYAFDIRIPDTETSMLGTVQQAVEFIERKLAEKRNNVLA